MEIIDWNFFKYDNGIINEEAWYPDIELTPIINDSWARGAIPVKQLPKEKPVSDNDHISIKTQSSLSSVNDIKKHSSKKSLINKGKQKKIKENIVNNNNDIKNKSKNKNNSNNDNNISKIKKTTLNKQEKVTKISESKSKKVKNITNTFTQNTKNDNKILNVKEKQKSYYKNLKNKTGISDIINNKQSTIQIQNMNKDGWNIDNIYNYTGHLISTIKSSPDKSFEQNIKAHLIEPIQPKQKIKDKKLLNRISDKKAKEEETINLSALYNNNLNNNIEKLQNDINTLNNFIKQKQSISQDVKKKLR